MIVGSQTFLLVLFILFGLSAVVQLFYYLCFYIAPATSDQEKDFQEKGPVTVIICARNEEQNLRNFLPSVLEQKYPEFEVIVVNDCSDDESYAVLGVYIKKYPNLRVSNITKDPKFTHYKKFAQFIGIKAARNELLLFLDADCRPESEMWLAGMASHFNEKIDFVLGYGGYIRKKGILNKYIRCDSMFIAIQYLGMAIRGIPYMGVGRNLAYRKSLFFRNKGFSGHSHLASGDDDLFVNSYAVKENVSVEFRKETHTRSVPVNTAGEFLKQKRRHLTTAAYYKFRDKVLLTTEPATRVIFYSLFIILLCFGFMWPVVIGIFTLRLVTQITVYALNQRKLNEPGLIPWLLLFDIFSPVINSIIYVTNFGQGAHNARWN